MATLHEDLLDCSICLDRFSDPRMLPCQHSYCVSCLDDLVTSSFEDEEGSIKCPQCRVRHTLPRGGVQGLPANFLLNNLLSTPAPGKGPPGPEQGSQPSAVHALLSDPAPGLVTSGTTKQVGIPMPPMLGGLFAEGMPKLRKTVVRTDGGNQPSAVLAPEGLSGTSGRVAPPPTSAGLFAEGMPRLRKTGLWADRGSEGGDSHRSADLTGAPGVSGPRPTTGRPTSEGLFAEGMPRLRKTGLRAASEARSGDDPPRRPGESSSRGSAGGGRPPTSEGLFAEGMPRLRKTGLWTDTVSDGVTSSDPTQEKSGTCLNGTINRQAPGTNPTTSNKPIGKGSSIGAGVANIVGTSLGEAAKPAPLAPGKVTLMVAPPKPSRSKVPGGSKRSPPPSPRDHVSSVDRPSPTGPQSSCLPERRNSAAPQPTTKPPASSMNGRVDKRPLPAAPGTRGPPPPPPPRCVAAGARPRSSSTTTHGAPPPILPPLLPPPPMRNSWMERSAIADNPAVDFESQFTFSMDLPPVQLFTSCQKSYPSRVHHKRAE